MQVTKIITFAAAHRLFNYKGACANIHGHNYKVELSVEGDCIGDEDGLLMDFKSVKKLLQEEVMGRFDHKLILFSEDPLVGVLRRQENVDLLVVPYNPTVEEMASHIRHLITKKLPEHVWFHSVKIWETDTSFCVIK